MFFNFVFIEKGMEYFEVKFFFNVIKIVGENVIFCCKVKVGIVECLLFWYIGGQFIGKDLINFMFVRNGILLNFVSELYILNVWFGYSG